MNFIITCERCEEYFNENDRTPLILPDCGHTFCEYCVADLLENEKACPNCNQEIKSVDPTKFMRNQKIIDILKREQPAIMDNENYVFCPRHFDKVIEYFCK
jgi:hypothetical protein